MRSLVNFLLENEVYNQFLDNFYGGKNSFSEYIKTTPERDYFYVAFDWETSKEGVEFWKNVNKKWLEYIN